MKANIQCRMVNGLLALRDSPGDQKEEVDLIKRKIHVRGKI